MTDAKKDVMGEYYFHEGTSAYAYEYLGAHRYENGTVFRVWAPNADKIFLVGNFNSWDESCPMEIISDRGIWEKYLSGMFFENGELYKFKIINGDKTLYKSDPYGFYFEQGTESASAFFESRYEWRDDLWLDFRKEYASDLYARPLNIYELHISSWKRDEKENPLTYRELAKTLPQYVKKMGYTHVELLPVMEHPYEASWGYQVCGYYAPSSRFGTPDDFKYLIDMLHTSGVGVILDWVPAHFPKDSHGLYEFDGQALYEYQGKDRMEHAVWGTRRFDVGREEVQSFLISNAVFWAKEFHADGLRVDAVSSMLYLDYDRKDGEWIPNVYGDNRCLEAIAFFKKLNGTLRGICPDVMTVAEESTAWSNITGFENDGLGFTYKWNMGFMNDTLDYAATDPYFRKWKHEKLTFPVCYSFSEKYILPISHDEVVHGKRSFLDKMPCDYLMKFAGNRAFAAYRMCFPGKKLCFMGEELGQFREWDHASSLEWFLLFYDSHRSLHLFYKEINHFYLSQPALYERDTELGGFSWIYPDMKNESVIAFRRFSKSGDEIIAVFNFTPVERKEFFIESPCDAFYEVFNTDKKEYGGSGIENSGVIYVHKKSGRAGFAADLPPMSCVIFEKYKSEKITNNGGVYDKEERMRCDASCGRSG